MREGRDDSSAEVHRPDNAYARQADEVGFGEAGRSPPPAIPCCSTQHGALSAIEALVADQFGRQRELAAGGGRPRHERMMGDDEERSAPACWVTVSPVVESHCHRWRWAAARSSVSQSRRGVRPAHDYLCAINQFVRGAF